MTKNQINQISKTKVMKKVKVTAHPETGKVFTQTMNDDGTPHLDKNGEEHGFIRVEQRTANLGFAYKQAVKKRSTLIPMTKNAYNESADVFINGSEHDGQIIREDKLVPWFEGQSPLQTAEGKTITSNGAPVYRREYFSSNQNASDIKLEVYDQIEATVAKKATEKDTVE